VGCGLCRQLVEHTAVLKDTYVLKSPHGAPETSDALNRPVTLVVTIREELALVDNLLDVVVGVEVLDEVDQLLQYGQAVSYQQV
jgi:hypothetical protein